MSYSDRVAKLPGKRIPWFVSDVTRKDWNWLLNTAVYGHLFDQASEEDVESLRIMGRRWKEYEKQGKWQYEGEWKHDERCS